MTRECHVRFCERLGAKLPWSTYLFGSSRLQSFLPLLSLEPEGGAAALGPARTFRNPTPLVYRSERNASQVSVLSSRTHTL